MTEEEGARQSPDANTNKKSFGKDVGKLVSGTVVAQIVGICLIPIITRIFGPEIYLRGWDCSISFNIFPSKNLRFKEILSMIIASNIQYIMKTQNLHKNFTIMQIICCDGIKLIKRGETI